VKRCGTVTSVDDVLNFRIDGEGTVYSLESTDPQSDKVLKQLSNGGRACVTLPSSAWTKTEQPLKIFDGSIVVSDNRISEKRCGKVKKVNNVINFGVNGGSTYSLTPTDDVSEDAILKFIDIGKGCILASTSEWFETEIGMEVSAREISSFGSEIRCGSLKKVNVVFNFIPNGSETNYGLQTADDKVAQALNELLSEGKACILASSNSWINTEFPIPVSSNSIVR
jgi:hypothetical protein